MDRSQSTTCLCCIPKYHLFPSFTTLSFNNSPSLVQIVGGETPLDRYSLALAAALMGYVFKRGGQSSTLLYLNGSMGTGNQRRVYRSWVWAIMDN